MLYKNPGRALVRESTQVGGLLSDRREDACRCACFRPVPPGSCLRTARRPVGHKRVGVQGPVPFWFTVRNRAGMRLAGRGIVPACSGRVLCALSAWRGTLRRSCFPLRFGKRRLRRAGRLPKRLPCGERRRLWHMTTAGGCPLRLSPRQSAERNRLPCQLRYLMFNIVSI